MKIGMITLSLYNKQKINNTSFCSKRQKALRPLTEKRKQLVEKNIKLVDFVLLSPRYHYPASDVTPQELRLRNLMKEISKEAKKDPNKYDNYISAGAEGLIYAANNYKHSKGKFSTYACYWIASKIASLYKQEAKKIKLVSLDKIPKEEGISLSSIIHDKKNKSPLHRAIIDEIFDIVQDLNIPDKEKEYFVMYYRQGYTLQEIGKKHSLSKEWVRQILKKIVDKIKREIKKNNNI